MSMNYVNLKKDIKYMEVFYDGQCGMCRTFIDWLKNQKHVLDLRCVDYRGEEAEEIFPEIKDYDPGREMVVRVDGEVVYQGAEGWVCCLWACDKYRDTAKKMNNRVLLPMVKKFCYLVSKNRFIVSKLLFRKKSEEIALELEKEQNIKCEGGCE